MKLKKDKKIKNYISDFKAFIYKGNVFDMAIGVIVGGAFGKIVTSLVNDILMPLIGIILGGLDFTNLTFTIMGVKVAYGSFIQSVVDFLIVSFCIFIIIKFFEKFKKKEDNSEEKKSSEVLLLEDIRDILRSKLD